MIFAFDTRKVELCFLGSLIALFAGLSIGFYLLEGRMQLARMGETMSVFLVALGLLLSTSMVANKQHPAGPPETSSQADPQGFWNVSYSSVNTSLCQLVNPFNHSLTLSS
ncbi:hypothetical protein B9Z19DRAFT_1072846 [Tuber borchii]|uniref:Uncharacterized protein n=1 Tax=Tuber borchii TaxID=42251 RepID=A0A2T7A6N9_TUBBO|nr:hypothetical protein B9Z19DRAFT_1072846 [Tuber borchii]